MMSKLTLSADSNTIQIAKNYAKMHNTSVSSLFANYIHGLAKQEQSSSDTASNVSTLNQLSGAISLPDNETYDDLRQEAVKNGMEYSI
jgi:hypothetical protein